MSRIGKRPIDVPAGVIVSLDPGRVTVSGPKGELRQDVPQRMLVAQDEGTVRAVDGDSALSPRSMEQIVRAVLRALHEERNHERRVRAEQRVTSGVSHEQAENEP